MQTGVLCLFVCFICCFSFSFFFPGLNLFLFSFLTVHETHVSLGSTSPIALNFVLLLQDLIYSLNHEWKVSDLIHELARSPLLQVFPPHLLDKGVQPF